jgi:hypothetical protein
VVLSRDVSKKRKSAHLKQKGGLKANQQPKEKKQSKKWFISFLVILALTLLSYANSVRNQFVFDDIF